MGKDDCASDARSFSGLDADGEGRAQDGCDKSSPALSAAQAAGHLLAPLPKGGTDRARANSQRPTGLECRVRRRSPACSIVRSQSDLARASGVRKDDPEGVVRVCVPPHGPPSPAVRGLTSACHDSASQLVARAAAMGSRESIPPEWTTRAVTRSADPTAPWSAASAGSSLCNRTCARERPMYSGSGPRDLCRDD